MTGLNTSTGKFNYNPNTAFQGTDSIKFKVTESSSGHSKEGLLTIKSDQFSLFLPPKIYAVQGQPLDIYLDNLILDANPIGATPTIRPYKFKFLLTTTSNGVLGSDKWSYTPTAADIGLRKIKVQLLNTMSNAVIEEKVADLYIAETTPVLAKYLTTTKVLMIGDSITAAGKITENIYNTFSSTQYPKLKFLGKVNFGGAPYAVEAYGGNTWTRFALVDYIHPTNGIDYSPFVYPGNILNFNQYMVHNLNGHVPNIVTIQLGTNDIFSTSNYTYNGLSYNMNNTLFPAADILIDEIRKNLPNVKIAIALSPPPNALQSAFNIDYPNTSYTRWGYKRAQHGYLNKMVEKYSNREFEAIYLSYPSLHISPSTGFDNGGGGAVHPNLVGYQQITKGYDAWFRQILKK